MRNGEPDMNHDDKTPRSFLRLGVPAAILLAVSLALGVYRPDRPVATIVPGSSSGPSFVVQVIRPRLGLPLGGIIPPQVFGQESRLVFASTSAGAAVRRVEPGRIELAADGWGLILAFDADGRVLGETQVEFSFVFEEQLRKVRCRPGDPAVGKVSLAESAASGEWSGHFDIELGRCEDAGTGQPLGWPPKPLILHGSFDRLVEGIAAE